nr:MAG TPA: hypothetical protein [Caudoviricetes sp.]
MAVDVGNLFGCIAGHHHLRWDAVAHQRAAGPAGLVGGLAARAPEPESDPPAVARIRAQASARPVKNKRGRFGTAAVVRRKVRTSGRGQSKTENAASGAVPRP